MYKVHKVTNKAAPLSHGQTSIRYVQNYLWTAGVTPPGQQLFITALSLTTVSTTHCFLGTHDKFCINTDNTSVHSNRTMKVSVPPQNEDSRACSCVCKETFGQSHYNMISSWTFSFLPIGMAISSILTDHNTWFIINQKTQEMILFMTMVCMFTIINVQRYFNAGFGSLGTRQWIAILVAMQHMTSTPQQTIPW